jgi:hypothetical protein
MLRSSVLAAAAALLWPSSALAQQPHLSAGFDAMTGMEGGGSGYAKGIRRARTTLRFSAEGYLEEGPKHWLSIGALVEVEPRASFGADLRYQFRFARPFVVHAGATSIIAPNYLIGGTFGFAYRIDVSKIVEININPLFNVYFLGGDLAKDTVLWQGMIAVGARFGLF